MTRTTTLQPRRRSPMFTRALMLLAFCVFASSAVLMIDFGNLTIAVILQFMGSSLVVGIVLIVNLMEDRRARSVVLTDSCVTSLIWTRAPGQILYMLKPLAIYWANLERIEHKGLLIHLHAPQGTISINTYLFERPDEVLKFINSHSSRKRTESVVAH